MPKCHFPFVCYSEWLKYNQHDFRHHGYFWLLGHKGKIYVVTFYFGSIVPLRYSMPLHNSFYVHLASNATECFQLSLLTKNKQQWEVGILQIKSSVSGIPSNASGLPIDSNGYLQLSALFGRVPSCSGKKRGQM